MLSIWIAFSMKKIALLDGPYIVKKIHRFVLVVPCGLECILLWQRASVDLFGEGHLLLLTSTFL